MRRAIALISTLVLAACNMSADAQRGEPAPARGEGSQRSFDVGSFDKVSLGGHHNVVVQVGPAASVRAEGDSEELDRLEIRVENGDLHIGTRKGEWTRRRGGQPVTVYVTTPTLAAASIGGSGDMRIDKVEGNRFSAAIGGSGDMEIASLRTGEATFSIAGSGGITAAGAAQRSTISIAGSGSMNLAQLESGTAAVSVMGSGNVRARAMETAEVSMMGSGNVAMSGSAKCAVNKMGSGNVSCEG